MKAPKSPSWARKSLYSTLIFFGTLIVLTIGYATWNSPIPMSSVTPGMSLTASGWNALVNNLTDLDSRVVALTARSCLSGMTKIGDFCIDNTPVLDAAGEDQKMAMQRCVWQNKHLCSFGEIKTVWTGNASLVCPGWVGRYSTSEIFSESSTREMTVFDCQNCSLASSACIWGDVISADTTDKSLCCLNP